MIEILPFLRVSALHSTIAWSALKFRQHRIKRRSPPLFQFVMGVSVSVDVDSWVQETIEALSMKKYDLKDPIYRHLLTAASIPSEIFVLESEYFEKLVYAKKSNLDNVLNVCLEHLTSDESVVRLNSAALLLRIFPFLWKQDSPIDFPSFIIGQRKIKGHVICPGQHIVESGLALLGEFPVSDQRALFDIVDGNMPVFDLLCLVVFGMLKHFKNETLYHQMIVTIQRDVATLLNVLFNYVHVGGRKGSIISLLTLLMFHPGGDFTPHAQSFVRSGGRLSQELVKVAGNETDLMCMLCAVSLTNDDAKVALNMSDANLCRLALLKTLMAKRVENTPEEVVAAWHTTRSPLARAVMARVAVPIPPEVRDQCEPLADAVFTDPHESEKWMHWFPQAIADMFLFTESFLFTRTGIRPLPTSFEPLDALVTSSSP